MPQAVAASFLTGKESFESVVVFVGSRLHAGEAAVVHSMFTLGLAMDGSVAAEAEGGFETDVGGIVIMVDAIVTALSRKIEARRTASEGNLQAPGIASATVAAAVDGYGRMPAYIVGSVGVAVVVRPPESSETFGTQIGTGNIIETFSGQAS